MLQKFKLTKFWDLDGFTFGNLPAEEVYGVYSARGLAHDLVDHTISFRKAKYVTVEQEIQAFGAAACSRYLSRSFMETAELVEYYLHRDVTPLPWAANKYLRKWYAEDIQDLYKAIKTECTDVSHYNAQMAARHYYWGVVMCEWRAQRLGYDCTSVYDLTHQIAEAAFNDMWEESFNNRNEFTGYFEYDLQKSYYKARFRNIL